MREGAGLEFVKDGNRKQGGFKCGRTVPGRRELTRSGGDVERSVGELPQIPVNRVGKAELLIECWRWRQHIRNIGLNILSKQALLAYEMPEATPAIMRTL